LKQQNFLRRNPRYGRNVWQSIVQNDAENWVHYLLLVEGMMGLVGVVPATVVSGHIDE
jgi:hypothetical protein